ncbi:Polyketide biosynthesis malonyl-ACP decarboxylase PksF (plasmid) [Streptomyces sp. YIM 121038]|nr:Polyketide biosynthesis malonyl-ACP decarboxylase PksF [Streptomyces sp. YIM 121038]
MITGMAVLNPLADDVPGFTAALRHGRSAITTTPEHRAGHAHAVVGAWLNDFTVTNWARRHLTDDPEAEQRLRLATAQCGLPAQTAACVAVAAVREAGWWDSPDADRAALVVAGNNLALDYYARMTNTDHLRPSHVLTHADVDVVGVVSEATGVRGEGYTLGGATASGTLAAIQGARLVRSGLVTGCLVVAPLSDLSPLEFRAYRLSGVLACPLSSDLPPRACRPFDRSRLGFVYGQGAAAIVVENAEHATHRGATPLAAIAGSGQHLDGRRGVTPTREGLVSAMRGALAESGMDVSDVDYVNAHAAGTIVGDAVEVAALDMVFGDKGQPLVNSTKPLTGHAMTAAGLQEIVASIVQMREGFCHPNPQLRDPLPTVCRYATSEAHDMQIDVALTNSFAFSGINCSLVLATCS